MPAKKDPNGVQATIERLTSKSPCPEELRHSLNKYLYEKRLFEGAQKNNGKKVLGKLSSPDTDVLVINLLALDQSFRGETETVIKIATKEIEITDLEKKIKESQKEFKRRLDIYTYWERRIDALWQVLKEESFDVRLHSLDSLLDAKLKQFNVNKISSFGLQAVQTLERIESRSRIGMPTVGEYVELADAYFSLEDYANAERNAVLALKLNKEHARAWFIRVIIALRYRNVAVNQIRYHEMVAQEIAEPMSSQESWALDMADEAADIAAVYNQKLEEILPNALLYWPRDDGGKFLDCEQRNIVRDLYIEHAFTIATSQQRHISGEQYSRINGFEAEWRFEFECHPYLQSRGYKKGVLPFNKGEIDVLKMLIEEYGKEIFFYFDIRDASSNLKEFKLLHLRWLLGLEGYEEHWSKVKNIFESSGTSYLENYIFRSTLLSRLWAHHQSLNGNNYSALQSVLEWHNRSIDRDHIHRSSFLLSQYALLFHRHFVRNEFGICHEIICKANEFFKTNTSSLDELRNITHPTEEFVSMPVHKPLYWKYLEVIILIKIMQIDHTHCDSKIFQILLEMGSLRTAFEDCDACFWIESEFFEGGGGDEYPVEPYGIDLREAAPWEKLIEQILKTQPTSKMTDQLKIVSADFLNG